MKERLKAIRKSLLPKVTQEKFGALCGKSRNAIKAYENGTVIPDASFIQLLCLKFNINEIWLRTGKGEMFLNQEDSLLHSLSKKHNLTLEDEHFISVFLQLTDEERETIVRCMSKMTSTEEYEVRKTLTKPDCELSPDEKLKRATEQVKEEKESEKQGFKRGNSSVSTGTNGLV